jgi:hypothetical protein
VDLQEPFAGPLTEEQMRLKQGEIDWGVDPPLKEEEKQKLEPMPKKMKGALHKYRRRHHLMITYDGFVEMVSGILNKGLPRVVVMDSLGQLANHECRRGDTDSRQAFYR